MTISEKIMSVINNNSTISQNSQKVHDVGEKKGRKIVGSMVNRTITEITAEDLDGVTNIGAYALYGCQSLTKIEIPSSVTSIDSAAFSGCTALSEIIIPSSVTSIGSGAFSGCDSLSIYTEHKEKPDGWSDDWNSNNGDVEWGWGYALPSKGISFESNGDGTCYVCGIGDCVDTNVVIPAKSPNGDSVTSIGKYAFKGCTGLTSIIIPNSVNKISYSVFSGCTGLTSVTIPDSVTSIGMGAFYGCTALTSVTIPDGVTDIDQMLFYNCKELISVTIPHSITVIGSNAFYGCKKLRSVVIPDIVTYMGENVFKNCIELTIYCEAASKPLRGWDSSWNSSNRPVVWGITGHGVTEDELHWASTSSGITIIGYTGSATDITIPETINGMAVTSIGGMAFYGCTNIANIYVPWAEGAVTGAPWSATNATIHYNS